MTGILADINIQRHVLALRYVWESEEYRELWDSLKLPILTFPDVGLPLDASDVQIWKHCQQHQLLLITANRNDDSPDSLEATIRTQNQPTSLPVFTLADADQLLHSKLLQEKVAVKLLEYFWDIEALRGTGRLYVP